MKGQIIGLLALAMSFVTAAQTINIEGVVKDAANGDVLPGVSITVKGTVRGTQTDFDGFYSLKGVEKGVILQFRYLGYKLKEVSAVVTLTNVSMQIEAESLDEIVIIGYGKQRKKESTGAVSVVDAKAIAKLNPTRIEQALQGQVAGVNITSSSGAPGSGLNIRIRGVSTNGDNRPLILVDGNPITDLSVINPSDIKSINILKDATAGIYGVRAANGVILIETKTGRKKAPLKINIENYFAFQQTSKKLDLLNGVEFANYVNEATGKGIYFIQPASGEIYNTKQSATVPLSTTDWQNEVFQTAPMFNTNVSANGGTEKLAYSFGVSYLNQEGVVGLEKSNFNRLTARTSLQYSVTDRLKISATAIYTHSKKNNLPEGGIGAILYNAVNSDPLTGVNDPTELADAGFEILRNGYGIVNTTAIEVSNPIAQISNAYNIALVDRISPTYGVEYSFLNNFTFNSKNQFNHTKVYSDIFNPLAYYGVGKSINRTTTNEVIKNVDIYEDYTLSNFITYTNSFNDAHNVTALFGYEVLNTKGQFTGNTGQTLRNGSNDFNDAQLENSEVVLPRFQPDVIERGGDIFENRLSSFFTRVQYNYKEKYLLSVVFRRDASSKFGPNNRVGYFPSASFGWNVSDESFLKDNSVISSLKLRGSYGTIGNDRISDFGFVARLDGEGTYSNNNEETIEDLLVGVAEGRLANPGIKWENQITGNIGFDMGLFSNKVRITVDAYNKKTEDLLIAAQISGLTGVAGNGASAPFINAGDVVNRGLEFQIAYNSNLSEDFNLNSSFNFSTLENEVTFVGGSSGFEQGGAFGVGTGIITSRMEVGLPIGYFYGYKTNGIFQNQEEIDVLDAASADNLYHKGAGVGDLKFVDTNKDGEITEADRTYIGDYLPDVTLGFNLGFTYKNFDFNSAAFASVGNDMVRDYERLNVYANKSSVVLNRWTPNNPSNTVPRATSGASINTDNFSDYFVEDASYLRIQNIQVGYTFSESIVSKIGLDKLRLYASANNIHTFTNYTGFDPSAGSGAPIGGGIDRGFYPVAKTYILGLNLNF